MEKKKLTKVERENGIKNIEERNINGAKEVVITLTKKENERVEKILKESAGKIPA